MNPLKRFARYKEVILIDDYSFAGGGGRPIYTYYRHQLEQGRSDILFLRMIMAGSWLKVLLLLFYQKRIIVNGIGTFRHWSVCLLCLFKKNVIIYLHEAAPHVEPFQKVHSVKFRLFKHFLATQKIAFVSEWQRKYFEGIGSVKSSKIVFNALNFPVLPETKKGTIAIGSIGYQTKNKNVDFFSRVADEAAKRSLPYVFYWVGGEGGEMQQLYRSPHVTWLGDQDQVMDILNHFDVLFFPSLSETFGLVLAEALFKGIRIVSFVESGLAPFLKSMAGCRIYENVSEDEVLKCIESVLNENVDLEESKALAYQL